MNQGWIKLHRSILEWEWYSDLPTRSLFLHLLLMANHEDNNWRGIAIKRGQHLTSLSKLARGSQLSIKQIRNSLNKLKTTNEVANEVHSNYRIITLLNYDKYQQEDKQDDKRRANGGQTRGKAGATNKNDKKEKDKKEEKEIYGELRNVFLTKEEYGKLQVKIPNLQDMIERLSLYIASKGDKYTSHYATLCNWQIMNKKDMPHVERQQKDYDITKIKL